jgi:serine/threonine-protein kinase HipA
MNTAFINIWGERVGAVLWDQELELASFEYDPRFLEKQWDLSPVKMPIANGNQIYAFPELRPGRNSEFDTFNGLPGLLADVLPDKYGNQLIDIWLAQQGRPAKSMNPVEKLCFIGKRGMGALEFEPVSSTSSDASYAVEIETLVDISRQMLEKREDFVTDLSVDQQKAMTDILRIGTSAGGARPKAVIAYNETTGSVKSGQAQAPDGYEHWLIKLDGVSDAQLGDSHGYGRVEMAYYEMAKDCGIDMMECKLLEENGRAHFMTKRYDRQGGQTKHHVQTWCGIEHYDFNEVRSYSYEQLFQTMRKLRLDYQEAEQMFRRMVFNVIARNCDDHTKNFSFRLIRDGQWTLAPAYDICHAYKPGSRWVSQHALSINGKRISHTKTDLLTVANAMNIKAAENTIDYILNTVSQWEAYAKAQNVNTEKIKAITKTLISVI